MDFLTCEFRLEVVDVEGACVLVEVERVLGDADGDVGVLADAVRALVGGEVDHLGDVLALELGEAP